MPQHADRIRMITVEIIGFIILTLLDQWTKVLSVAHLKGQSSFVLINGVLEFYYLENHGAAFSLFQNAMWFFYIIAIAAMVFIAWFLYRMPEERRYLPVRIAMVSIAAGALGNLIDRMQLGYVRDFIYFSLINFPVFNIADIYVTVAVAVLIILILFYYKDDDFTWIERRSHGK